MSYSEFSWDSNLCLTSIYADEKIVKCLCRIVKDAQFALIQDPSREAGSTIITEKP